MRLVDADELTYLYFDDEDGNRTFSFVPKEFIENAPTIDAVEVIRCENCKYFSPDEKREKWGKCKIWKAQVLKDGYCSQGEKNEKN